MYILLYSRAFVHFVRRFFLLLKNSENMLWETNKTSKKLVVHIDLI